MYKCEERYIIYDLFYAIHILNSMNAERNICTRKHKKNGNSSSKLSFSFAHFIKSDGFWQNHFGSALFFTLKINWIFHNDWHIWTSEIFYFFIFFHQPHSMINEVIQSCWIKFKKNTLKLISNLFSQALFNKCVIS